MLLMVTSCFLRLDVPWVMLRVRMVRNVNVVRIVSAFMRLSLLFMTVNMKLPRVLGRHEHPTWSTLSFMFASFFELNVTKLCASRQLPFYLLS